MPKPVSSYSFHKSERLCSKKLIEALFGGGHKSMSAYPLRAVFMTVEDAVGEDEASVASAAPVPSVQVLISVSKRHFKHAVDRNRVKRQLREAYRLNKPLLLDKIGDGSHVVVAFIWLSDEHFKSSVLHAKMRKLLLRIGEEL